jgi:hypothetical protein
MTEEENKERLELIEKWNCADITQAQTERLSELDEAAGLKNEPKFESWSPSSP